MAFASGLVKLSFGVGAGVLLTPVLALVMSPQAAVAALAPILWSSDLHGTLEYRHSCNYRVALPIILSTIPATALGAFLLAQGPGSLIRKLIGAAALLAGALLTVHRLGLLHLRRFTPATWHGILLGTAGGILGAAATGSGVLYSSYLVLALRDRRELVGTSLFVLFVTDTIRIVSYWVLSVLDTRTLVTSLLASPLVIAGGWVGARLQRYLSDAMFYFALVAIVLVSGLQLLTR